MRPGSAETNYFTTILSSLSALGTIVAAVAPILPITSPIRESFVDKAGADYLSIAALAATVCILWVVIFPGYFALFPNTEPEKLKKISLISFLSSAFLFYFIKILYISQNSIFPLAAVLQALTYLTTFGSLAFLVGMLMKDTLSNLQFARNETFKVDLIRETLIKMGIIEMNLKIHSINKFQPREDEKFPSDWILANEVVFSVMGEKEVEAYRCIFTLDYSQILYIEKVKNEAAQTTLNLES